MMGESKEQQETQRAEEPMHKDPPSGMSSIQSGSQNFTANQLMKRIQSINVANSSNVVKLLNDLLYYDPNACRTLLQFKVYCNPEMLNHPHIQVASQADDTIVQVGIVGVLNGVLSKLGIPRIRTIYMEDVLVGFDVNMDDIQVIQKSQQQTFTTSSESEGNSDENDDESEDSSEELQIHREEGSGVEKPSVQDAKPRSEDNRDGDSGERSRLDAGEAFKATLQPEYNKVHVKEV